MARYSAGAIAFHWIIAVLVALNYAFAWIAEDLPKEQAGQLMGNHKAVGITVLLLTVARILWRLTHRPPAFLTSLQPWEAMLARVTHGLFYVLMIAIPLAGWLMHSAYSGGAPVNAFGLFSYPGLPLAADKAGAHTAGEVHEVLATAMLFLAGLHVLGALKHQFLDRDGSLARMLPWG
jgi:cytochrome b561